MWRPILAFVIIFLMNIGSVLAQDIFVSSPVEVRFQRHREAKLEGVICEDAWVEAQLATQRDALSVCHAKVAASDGYVGLTWQVGGDGRVASLVRDVSTLEPAGVDVCVAEVVQKMSFGANTKGGCMTSYRLHFHSSSSGGVLISIGKGSSKVSIVKSISEPVLSGSCNVEAVRSKIYRKRKMFEDCLSGNIIDQSEKGELGDIRLIWFIDASGQMSEVKIVGADVKGRYVPFCVRRVAASIDFTPEAVVGEGMCHVDFSMSFREVP